MVLERTVRGEQVNGRPIVVERVAAGAPVAQCQILFVPQSQSDLEGVALRASSGGPILTVGESPDFLKIRRDDQSVRRGRPGPVRRQRRGGRGGGSDAQLEAAAHRAQHFRSRGTLTCLSAISRSAAS